MAQVYGSQSVSIAGKVEGRYLGQPKNIKS
jgi:hypothetical protein